MRAQAFLLLLSATVAGCSSSVDSTHDPAVVAFAQRYTDAICGRKIACHALADHLAEECRQAHKFEQTARAVAEGHASFDQASADACIQAVSSLTCQELATLPETIPKTFDACGKVFQGHVAPGQPCATDDECDNGVCGSLDQTCPGVCQAKKKPGDACSTQDCGYSDHACLGTDTCAAIGGAGDPCFTAGFVQCKYGLACVSSVCTPFGKDAKEGEDCTASTCAAGLACNGDVCFKPGLEGDAGCDQWSCAEGLVCKGYWLQDLEASKGPQGTGACAKPAQIGGPCVDVQGAVAITGCATGLQCINGACAMPPAGGDCGPSGLCAPGHYCDPSGQCVPQDPDGTACIGGVNGQCKGGGCRADVCASPCTL